MSLLSNFEIPPVQADLPSCSSDAARAAVEAAHEAACLAMSQASLGPNSGLSSEVVGPERLGCSTSAVSANQAYGLMIQTSGHSTCRSTSDPTAYPIPSALLSPFWVTTLNDDHPSQFHSAAVAATSAILPQVAPPADATSMRYSHIYESKEVLEYELTEPQQTPVTHHSDKLVNLHAHSRGEHQSRGAILPHREQRQPHVSKHPQQVGRKQPLRNQHSYQHHSHQVLNPSSTHRSTNVHHAKTRHHLAESHSECADPERKATLHADLSDLRHHGPTCDTEFTPQYIQNDRLTILKAQMSRQGLSRSKRRRMRRGIIKALIQQRHQQLLAMQHASDSSESIGPSMTAQSQSRNSSQATSSNFSSATLAPSSQPHPRFSATTRLSSSAHSAPHSGNVLTTASTISCYTPFTSGSTQDGNSHQSTALPVLARVHGGVPRRLKSDETATVKPQVRPTSVSVTSRASRPSPGIMPASAHASIRQLQPTGQSELRVHGHAACAESATDSNSVPSSLVPCGYNQTTVPLNPRSSNSEAAHQSNSRYNSQHYRRHHTSSGSHAHGPKNRRALHRGKSADHSQPQLWKHL